MRYLSTFSGVGGFELGFDQLGWTCVGQIEQDPKCQEVLTRHWPDTPLHGDITTGAKEWADEHGITGNVDLICGGFPCQPFSVAGKRLGRDDLRGNLFWNLLDLADHVGARWLVLENVPGLLTSGTPKGEDFRSILQSLADAGFDAEWRVFDSQRFGVPQRRRRLYIVAHRDPAIGRGSEVLTQREGSKWHPPTVLAPWAGTTRTVEARPGTGVWAGSAQASDTAAPLLSLTGGPRTSDIEGATWVSTWSKKHRAASDGDYESWAEESISPTLNTFDSGDTRATALVTGFYPTGGTHGVSAIDDTSPAIKVGSGIGIPSAPAVAYGFNPQNGGGYGDANDGLAITEDGTGPLSTSQKVAVATHATVRRLTPTECERLQGWPPGHTALTADGTPIADSHRYRMCGNGVTSVVAHYVGWLIQDAIASSNTRAGAA